jgi:galactose mutarotase-like enzyme
VRDLAEAEENVVISKGDCTITLMPAFGGKIASLRIASAELLQAPLKPLAPRTQTMAFSDSDASGWDECLPSVAGCTVETEAGLATIPDHGDLWRIPWQVLTANEDSATLRAKCFSLPLQLTRSILLAESATGWRLEFLYSLTNLGAYPVPWSWSAHPLFAVDPGDRIELPREIQTLRLEGSRCNRLGKTGNSVSWPVASSQARTEVGSHTDPNSDPNSDLSLVPCRDSSIGDKLFAGPFGLTQPAWCSLERVGLGLRLTMHFEPSLTPCLGLWLCYGGWPEEPGAKQFCVAPEPATAPVDSLEQAGSWSRWLEPGETFNWPMELLIDRIAQDTHMTRDPSREGDKPAP